MYKTLAKISISGKIILFFISNLLSSNTKRFDTISRGLPSNGLYYT